MNQKLIQNVKTSHIPISNSSDSLEVKDRSWSLNKNKIKSTNKISLFHPNKLKSKAKNVTNISYFSNKMKEEAFNSNQFSIIISSPNNSKINSEMISHCSPKECDAPISTFKHTQVKLADDDTTQNVNINYKYIETSKNAIYFSDEDRKYSTNDKNSQGDYKSQENVRAFEDCFIKNKYKLLLGNYNKNI